MTIYRDEGRLRLAGEVCLTLQAEASAEMMESSATVKLSVPVGDGGSLAEAEDRLLVQSLVILGRIQQIGLEDGRSALKAQPQ
jgi:hypothetical protein